MIIAGGGGPQNERFYVATAWGNRDRARQVMAGLRRRGLCVVYDWTHTDEGAYQGDPRFRGAVSQEELDAIDRCDCLLLILPGGRGSMIEFGYALAKGKRVVVVGDAADLLVDGYATGLLERGAVKSPAALDADLNNGRLL